MFELRLYKPSEESARPVRTYKNVFHIVTGNDPSIIGVRIRPNKATPEIIKEISLEYPNDFEFFSVWET